LCLFVPTMSFKLRARTYVPIIASAAVIGLAALYLRSKEKKLLTEAPLKQAIKKEKKESSEPAPTPATTPVPKPVVPEKRKGPVKTIFKTKVQGSAGLCAYVVESAKAAIQDREIFHLAVAGGSVLDALVYLKNYKSEVDFSKFVLSFVDHKCIPPEHDQATAAKCKAKFVDESGISLVIMPVSTPQLGTDGSVEAEYYAEELQGAGVPHDDSGFPVFDMVILGLEEDGSVGCIHPMGPAVATTDKTVAGSPKEEEPSSITLTIESINNALEVVVAAFGEDKKEAVKRALKRPAEEPRGTYPAQLLKKPIYFLDKGAAAAVSVF